MPTLKRTLHLRREALTELTPADLAAIRGGDAGYTVGDHCGPPFDTKWLDKVTAALSGALCPTTR
jgi:hypothetical protein